MRRIITAVCVLVVSAPALLRAQAPAAASASDWRRGAVCYEIFVRSFYDGDGDGIGDLRGLIRKLDYVNDGDPETRNDLGASCIWLMPVAQSASYHGYDVTNYYRVDRDYGTEQDFKRLVAEAHRRGIRVLVDLVLNHTSSEHPYFKSALRDPASPFRDWYVWSPRVKEAPGWSVPVWHPVPGRDEYYYGLFWSGMPDLNLGNPEVRAEAERIGRYWIEEMGVDGFRMDAVIHFFEEEGVLKHAPATHAWLRDYVAALREVAPDVYTVGEVWDSTGAILPYYPDQLESYFIFEVADALIDAVRTGSKRRFVAAVERVQRDIPRGRWSPFLRNHDQTRTMTELGGDVARARLAATLLLTLPGIPFVYYGEEIGMTGSKSAGDPRLRTPMHWTRERAAGFTRSVPWEPLQPDSFTANVALQDPDPASLLNHYRRLIHLRAATPALGSTGEFIALDGGDDAVVAYLRREGGQTVLVVANLDGRPRAGVALTSTAAVLAPGEYVARPLLAAGGAAPLRVADDGRIRGWTPVRELEALEGYVFEIARRD
ncbi:MAG TPA: alpha-amylase family glycosyl hydrolase [Longimicrobiales bacterium]